MIEEKAKQFEKRPPSQFQQSKFYFRGGDVLREQEYLQEQYKKALADYRAAQANLKYIENQVRDATDVLTDQEGYTNALASFLEADTESSKKEVAMKQRLRELESEIDQANQEIAALKATQNQASLAILQKEKAYYLIEIQRGNKMIENYKEQSDNAIKQIAACTINKKYRDNLDLEYQVSKTSQKKTFMKHQLQKVKNEFDSKRRIIPCSDNESKAIRAAMLANIDLKKELILLQEREERRKTKHEQHIDNLINQIEELNQRMSEIGIEEEEQVETDELRKRCVNEDYSDVDEEEYENENENEKEKEKGSDSSESQKNDNNEED